MKVRGNFGDLNIDRRTILKWMFNEYVLRVLTEFPWLRTGPMDFVFMTMKL
jgi:hypothetical protein